jgi:ATP-dependent protease Clp ATPase subunit
MEDGPKIVEKPLCSWCHKSQDEVAVLIATPKGLPPPRSYICDECVAVCVRTLEERDERISRSKTEQGAIGTWGSPKIDVSSRKPA